MNRPHSFPTERGIPRMLEAAIRMNRITPGETGSETSAAVEDICQVYALDGVFFAELSTDGKTLAPIHAYTTF
jgi:hypothetical protein